MERSFSKEVEALRLGAGETFRGEGILAVTKALLQSGVSYVGGYQGAPVSHLLDVMVEAKDLLAELGVHVETCTNEAAAAAMLGASINYPLRGAVTWKSIVGTNVAADALSNLASPGVVGGALIVLGEDYGEGASVIQERSYAYAMKSSIWLIDPRPDLPTIVHIVEKGFELSEASHAPVMLDLRVRACHLTGEFTAKDNKRGLYNGQHRLAGPVRFEYRRLAHPPATFAQERLKIEQRLPAAQKFIAEQKLNERIAGESGDIGLVVLGGLTNGLLRALARLDLADLYGASRIPIYVLNVAYPLVPQEVQEFCAGKRAVLVVEEGSPDYVEQQINVILRSLGADTRVYGKGCPPITRRRLCCAASRLSLRRHSRTALMPKPFRAVSKILLGIARTRSRRSPIFRRGRRIFAPAVRSARSSPRSNWRSANSDRSISVPISAAIRSRLSLRSRSVIPFSATACRWRAPPRSRQTWRSVPSR
jgi:indolepyruvate ferredoxin oxidoreductase alpha subunit